MLDLVGSVLGWCIDLLTPAALQPRSKPEQAWMTAVGVLVTLAVTLLLAALAMRLWPT